MSDNDLVAALDSQKNLLGGLPNKASRRPALIPLYSIPNLQRYQVPLANLFDTYAVHNFDISKIEDDLAVLIKPLERYTYQCTFGAAASASFTIGCLHHSAVDNLGGNFLVNTIFTFGVGELRGKDRQIFLMADSTAASARQGDEMPGRDRFTYHRNQQQVVETAHEIALGNLSAELSEMFKGFRKN